MFHLHIATPEKTIFDGTSDYLSLLTEDGMQVILPNHEPYMCAIELGEIIYQEKETKYPIATLGGFLQVAGGDVYVLLSRAIRAKEIDIEEEKKAKKRAEELIKEMSAKEDTRTLQAQIKIANLHITTARKYHGDKHIPDNTSSENL